MLDIEYKGANGIILATKNTTVIADPKISVAGLKDIKTADEVELATESRFLVSKAAKLIIDRPGEYEIGDFSIHGIAASRHIDTTDEKDATIYRLEAGDMRVALLGNIAPKLNEEQLEALGVIDILIIPVGGNGYTLDATSAAALVRQIDPKVVIPIHYADDAITYEVPQDSLETFTKELGAPVEPTTAKLKIKGSSSLPQSLTVLAVARS